MRTEADILSPAQKAFGAVFWVVALCVAVYCGKLGIDWVVELDNARERGWKIDCQQRGGKVIEHKGGFARFSCDGPTTFN